MKYFAVLLLFMTLLPSYVEAQLNIEQESARDNGITLYNQYKTASAISFLTIAAEAGDPEAQYYLGEALRKRNRYMTPEAQHWYEAAANNGSIFAMIQLDRQNDDLCKKMDNCPTSKKSSSEWLSQAKNQVMKEVRTGDPESLYLMYEINFDRTWLEKSASAGYALAQYWMAVGDRQGEGFFLLPGKRDEAISKWLKAASEGGNPKAMMEYIEILYKKGDLEGVRRWLQAAAETGDQKAISSYGSYIAHAPDQVGYPLDLVKGYALISLLKELDGGGAIQDFVQDTLEEIGSKMTPEQIESSKAVAEEWKATHSPLSFFPEKLGR
ncbi:MULTISPECIES: tetratricopeptide repeat protein [unclassified Pseudomonas]|uniref:tetratricopeptide repeat protein n=1 Tax=unclassified Pseudomonas TaxID=196821 RepID=UPI00215CEC8C|nr:MULTISPECIES: sel1 repeat family protein [unclassified Pseudomonas]MCR8931445.1 sel1 repeat family protein [Pseudomonas sp. S11A4]MCR8975053.1 sel1 repeat family protein [Pseudomonas sp. S11P7]